MISFSRRLDVYTAENLASLSGLFANFKYGNDRVTTFTINRPFSWHGSFLMVCGHFLREVDFINDFRENSFCNSLFAIRSAG